MGILDRFKNVLRRGSRAQREGSRESATPAETSVSAEPVEQGRASGEPQPPIGKPEDEAPPPR